MATYQRLTVGQRPIVLTFPQWLLHDDDVDRVYRAFRRALGGPVPTYQDADTVVVVVPAHRVAGATGEEAAWALHALQDELTVWRLSTADGAHNTREGYGRSDRARMARNSRRNGHAPRQSGWSAA